MITKNVKWIGLCAIFVLIIGFTGTPALSKDKEILKFGLPNWSEALAISAVIADILENQIMPLYYDCDQKGVPVEWMEKVKQSFVSTIFHFSGHRMVWNYLQQYYIPAMKRAEKYSAEEYRELHQFTKWKNRIQRLWKSVHLTILDGQNMDEAISIFYGRNSVFTFNVSDIEEVAYVKVALLSENEEWFNIT